MSIISKLAEGDMPQMYKAITAMARMYAAEANVMLDDSPVAEVIVDLMTGFALQFAEDLISSKEFCHEA